MDNLKAKGRLIIKVYDNVGNLKKIVEVDNLVVSTGVNLLLNRLYSDVADPISHMEIGDGTTAASLSDTTLESPLARVAFDSVSVDGSVITMVATFPDDVGTGAITEAGLFNASEDGLMISRTVFPQINKTAESTITITWLITLAS